MTGEIQRVRAARADAYKMAIVGRVRFRELWRRGAVDVPLDIMAFDITIRCVIERIAEHNAYARRGVSRGHKLRDSGDPESGNRRFDLQTHSAGDAAARVRGRYSASSGAERRRSETGVLVYDRSSCIAGTRIGIYSRFCIAEIPSERS